MLSLSKALPIATLACAVGACSYVLMNNPTDAQPDPIGGCAFKAMTGYDCPGCGGTRMIWYLLHGNIKQATHYHVIALLTIPVLIYLYVAWVSKVYIEKEIPTKFTWSLLYVIAIVWIGFSVLRNLSMFSNLYV